MAELSGLAKWAELLGDAHGLNCSRLHVLFCGPEVPRKLDGTTRRVPHGDSGELVCAFVRDTWHGASAAPAPPVAALLAAHPPQLALCFNSGLAEHARSWLPTLSDLYWRRRVPIACTSYHRPEAELDARTLAVRLGVLPRNLDCMPNPFASRLPHLDEAFPGRTFVSNAFLSVAVVPRRSVTEGASA